MTTPLRFDSLAQLSKLSINLPEIDTAAADAAHARQIELTKPPGSLGRLEDLAIFMAGWLAAEKPLITSAQALVFAGNHGVCAQGVNPFPQAVTAQMVANFQHGGAAINQLCNLSGADLSVIPLDLDTPTADFTESAAMSEEECLAAMQRGAEAVDPDAGILILGEMGIGNSTVAAALSHAAFGSQAADWVGAGTGSLPEGIDLKARVVAKGVELHQQSRGLAQLAALGGREQAAICGAVLAARMVRIPVLLDGFICTAATAPLYADNPVFLDHCLIGHASREPGHRKLCEAMGKEPVLSLDMALGEGSGAALALSILRGALACHNGMATFAEAGVDSA
jgi:nicotinate-nucleotide--dimethylbenzimidazole phosphoribosyltransferase